MAKAAETKRVLPFPALKDKRRGRDEMNLAEFPLGLLHDKEDPSRHTVSFVDTITDSRFPEPIQRTVVVTSSQHYGGLPTAFDQDILLGLVNLTKANNNFTERRVYFTRHQLVELLGLPDKGQTYQRIARSFHKWKGVSVHYEDAWWKKGEEDWGDEGFAFIDHFKLFDSKALRRKRHIAVPKQFEFPFSHFTWGETIFQSFCDEYVRTLDLEFYISLQYPTSKRLFRFLGKRFYRGKTQRFNLGSFAFEKIGLSRSYEGNTAAIKRKLRVAVRELEERGFLKPLPESERYSGRGKNCEVVFMTADQVLVEPSTPVTLLTQEQESARLLLEERNVHPVRAAEIARQMPSEKIAEHVEAFDYLCSTDSRPKSPAGYLLKSIEDNYALPSGFVSTKAREKAAAREREARRAEALAEDSERKAAAERRKVAEAFWSALTVEERGAHETRAFESVRKLFPNGPSGAAREALLLSHALSELGIDTR